MDNSLQHNRFKQKETLSFFLKDFPLPLFSIDASLPLEAHTKDYPFSFVVHSPLSSENLAFLRSQMDKLPFPLVWDVQHDQEGSPHYQDFLNRHSFCLHTQKDLPMAEQAFLEHTLYTASSFPHKRFEKEGILAIGPTTNSPLFSRRFFKTYGVWPSSLIQDQSFEEIKQFFGKEAFPWWIPPSLRYPQMISALLEKGFLQRPREYILIHRKKNGTQKNLWASGASHNRREAEEGVDLPSTMRIKPVTREKELMDFLWVQEEGGDMFHFYKNFLTPHSKQFLFVGYHQGHPMGSGSLFQASTGWVLFNLKILPAYRRQGYAQALISFLLHQGNQRKNMPFFLTTSSPEALSLYKKMGFFILAPFLFFEHEGGL